MTFEILKKIKLTRLVSCVNRSIWLEFLINQFLIEKQHVRYTCCVDNSYKESSIDLETNTKSIKNWYKTKNEQNKNITGKLDSDNIKERNKNRENRQENNNQKKKRKRKIKYMNMSRKLKVVKAIYQRIKTEKCISFRRLYGQKKIWVSLSVYLWGQSACQPFSTAL